MCVITYTNRIVTYLPYTVEYRLIPNCIQIALGEVHNHTLISSRLIHDGSVVDKANHNQS